MDGHGLQQYSIRLRQSNIPHTTTPPSAWTVHSNQDGAILLCFLHQILRDGFLHTLVVNKGYLSYCCLSVCQVCGSRPCEVESVNKRRKETKIKLTLLNWEKLNTRCMEHENLKHETQHLRPKIQNNCSQTQYHDTICSKRFVPLISGIWHFLPEKGSSMDILSFFVWGNSQ